MSKENFTKPRVSAFKCPPDRQQAFCWDTEVSGLGLRATPRGKSAYIFQKQHEGRTVRITIGDVGAWSIPDARMKARELQRQLDNGENPIEVKRHRHAARQAAKAQRDAEGVFIGALWPTYLVKGRPKGKDKFRDRYLHDLRLMASPGGEPKKRGTGLTMPGPLYLLLAEPLATLDEDRLLSWYRDQESRGRAQAARALMMLRGFLRWCIAQPEYRSIARGAHDAARSPSLVGELPAAKRRIDSIEPSQVAGWWKAVEQLPNVHASAYLRALLMTGLRRESMASLQWKNVDLRWKIATFTDKVYGTRTIPLGDQFCTLIEAQPRSNTYVFSGRGGIGCIRDPRASMAQALARAGLGHVSIHGLRRSFALLAEDAGVPVGAAAQYMGHSPSGTHEGYKIRSLDQLRASINRIEVHVLKLVREGAG